MQLIGRVSSFVAVRGGLVMAMLATLAGGTAAAEDIVVTAANGTRAGQWAVASDTTASTGKVMRHIDAGAPKLSSALASPANYFEVTFTAQAGRAYRLWMRGRAQSDSWANDSVYIQFDKSVTSSGGSTWRIGTTSGMAWNLEDCSDCGLRGWKWQDNGWGSTTALGPTVYFSTTGTQRMRIQTREDGLSIDQIVLSSSTYLSSAPTGTLGADGGTVALPSTSATDVTLDASKASRAGKWTVASDSSAVGGYKVRHPDGGAARVSSALSSPSNYFELSFNAVAGVGYRLWMRGRADGDDWDNDSVYIQFDKSVTSSGSSTWRIGTTSAMDWNLEDCSGCGLSGWKWQDNGWGSTTALGPLVYFSTTGTQKIRVQTREDGLSIDRIVLSPSSYLTKAPPSPTTTAPAPEPEPEPEPEPAPAPSGSTLKVLTWNIHHGSGMDGRYNIDRIAAYIAKTGANVVSLNEVERYTGWGNEDQPARLASLLKTKTGKSWYYNFAQRDGYSNGQGNVVLSIYPFESSSDYELSASRSVARAAFIVNGIRVNVFSTHLDDGSQSTRVTQMKQLISWAATYPEQRIIAGDFNCYGSWIDTMEGSYSDAWALAVSKGYASGSGATRSGSRIDYVFHSRSASRLYLTDAQVFDGRDPSGVAISDHRPVMATYTVK